MIVEFVGLPGAGKSWLAGRVLEELQRRGVEAQVVSRAREPISWGGRLPRPLPEVVRRLGVYAGYLWTVLRGWRWAIIALRTLVTSSRSVRDAMDALRWTVVTMDNCRVAAGKSDVWLLEEGPVQRAFLLFVDADRVGPLHSAERFGRVSPPTDLAVVVGTPMTTALDRLENRDRGVPTRLAGLDRSRLTVTLAAAEQMLSTVVPEHRSTTITVPATTVTTTEAVVDRIIDMLDADGRRRGT